MIVVTGASGNLGRLTVAALLKRVDASRVRALSRTPGKLADVAALGVRTGHADLADPAALPAAFDGAERLLLISIGGLAPEHARQQADAIDAAVAAGVGHVLYTSIPRAAEPGNGGTLAGYHGATERHLAASGLPFTVLRFNIWPEMFLFSGIAQRAVATGVLPTNAGEGRVGYVTRADSAAVAAAVLAEGGSRGQTLEVTGPAALTDEGIAAALSGAGGRPVRCEPVGDAGAADALAAWGTPRPLAEAWAGGSVQRREGWFDVTTHAVERLTGQRPTPVAEFFAGQQW
jgi:NAD(P)H dehydrogenase (quinone)